MKKEEGEVAYHWDSLYTWRLLGQAEQDTVLDSNRRGEEHVRQKRLS